MKQILLFLCLSVCLASSAAATTNRAKFWFGGDLDGSLSANKDWRFNAAVQARFGDNDSKFEQFILRPSLYYVVNKDFSLGFGYDFIPTVSSSRLSALLEQRVWPQLRYKYRLSSGHSLSFRSRYELRWFEGSSQMNSRFRQRVEYSIKDVIKPNIVFDIFDEVFLSLNNTNWVAAQTINQNRIFAGFVIPLERYSSIDIGYMNIFRPRTSQNSMDHVLLVAVSLNVDKSESRSILAL